VISRLVIFGASGDLTARYLVPALARLWQAGLLPEDFCVTGVGRRDADSAAFRQEMAEALDRFATEVPPAARQAVCARLEYRRADSTKAHQVAAALTPLTGPFVAYLALPPAVFAPTIEALAAGGLPTGSRIVVEKPFGEDVTSAQALNQLLHRTVPETAVFRMDHFLGMQTVQNILGLRFANRVFESLWNGQHIAGVEIIWDETLTLEGRAAYYDAAGALRDMLQNHLLQLLCLVAMEPPPTLDARDLRDHKVGVLRAVRRLTPAAVAAQTVRGRYSAGRIGARAVPAYVEEPGVDPRRGTETFAQVTLMIDNWRWAGVPFTLRSGKALHRERREVAISFKPVPHLAFGQRTQPQGNVLRLTLDPERVALGLNINGPGDPFTLAPVELDVLLAPQELPAYARLLLDVLRGDPTLSLRDDEAEESWRIVEPILDAWAAGHVPLGEYPAGSMGPAATTVPHGRAGSEHVHDIRGAGGIRK
jgi:glucose-6-phosphate 1-dehydrogenase